MLADTLKTLFFSYIPSLTSTPSGWSKCNCPMCHIRGHSVDTSQRLGFKFTDTGLGFNCFQCGLSTRWETGDLLTKNICDLLEVIGVPENDIKRLKFEAFQQHSGIQPETDTPVPSPPETKWKKREFPETFLSIEDWLHHGCDDPQFLKVVSYLKSRGMYYPSKFFWTPNKDDMLNRRAILPFYHRGNFVGYTARYYVDSPPKVIPRYSDLKPKHYVYNLDNQRNYDRALCILTEGVLDAMCVDGISACGKSISVEQEDVINRLNKTIVVCPDRDKNGEPLIQAAIRNGWYVSFPKWENDVKDAAEACKRYGRVATLKSILNNITDNKLKIITERKMEKYRDE